MSNENAPPLVSIVVPVYNLEEYLPRCVDSLLAQTHRNIEILLVDDGSLDGSRALCDAYAARDSRVTVIGKKNGGLSDARNAGIEVAKGEWIAFVDADDYVSADYIRNMLRAALEKRADLVMCGFECVSEGGESIRWQPGRTFMNLSGDVGWREAMAAMSDPTGGVHVVAWNKLYARALIGDIRFPFGRINEDQFVIHRILSRCERMVCLEESLYFYVQRGGSIMSQAYSLRNMDAIDAFLDRTRYFAETGEETLAGLSYRRCLNELAKARALLDFSVGENREAWKDRRSRVKALRGIAAEGPDHRLKMRYIGAVYLPRLYHWILTKPWRNRR